MSIQTLFINFFVCRWWYDVISYSFI